MTKLFRGAIIGAPGSGKGTLSARIVKNFDIVHVSTGDVFRKSVEGGSEAGNLLKKFMEEGKYVPDDLATEITVKKLNELKDKNWLLDGYPRTLTQAHRLFEVHPLNLVISLNVPCSVIADRVKNRWIHPGSGRIYNTIYKPPKVAGKDDVTGEPLIQRGDDSEEALLVRLKLYSETISPLLEFYKTKNILREIEGDTSDELWPPIRKEILKFMPLKSKAS